MKTHNKPAINLRWITRYLLTVIIGVSISTHSALAQLIDSESSNYQSVSLTPADTMKYFRIGSDFFIDIGDTKKSYPKGYVPQWAMIGNFGQMQFNKVNYLQGRLKRVETHSLGIDQFEGKTYIYFGGFLGCNCAARLLKDNEQAVVSNNSQTFFARDFRQITADGKVTASPCKNMTMSFYDTGGWKLKLTLSIDNRQALTVNATVESLTAQQGYINHNGTDVSNVWTATNISMPNLMTPEKAWSIKQQKEKAQKDAVARQRDEETKEKERHILDSLYQKMLVKIRAKPAANPKTRAIYKGYNLKEEVQFKNLVGKKLCVVSGYRKIDSLYEELNKLDIDLDVIFSRLRYNLTFKPEELEPHERDKRFTGVYLLNKKYNELVIEMAARYMICDNEKVKELNNLLRQDANSLIDDHDYNEMLEYLKSKP